MTTEEPYWIALYTKSHHEVSVARQLTDQGIESYVPLRREVHQWSDRRKWMDTPLIPSYVFVRIPLRQCHRTYNALGVVRIVMFHRRIALIHPDEIELLKRGTRVERAVIVSAETYRQHDEVEIIGGIFNGYRGRVVHANKMCTISIRIEELETSIVVEVPRESVRIPAHEEVVV